MSHRYHYIYYNDIVRNDNFDNRLFFVTSVDRTTKKLCNNYLSQLISYTEQKKKVYT